MREDIENKFDINLPLLCSYAETKMKFIKI